MTDRDVDLPAGGTYLRGGGAGSDGARMIRWFVEACFVSLAALVVVLFVQAAGEAARANRLHLHGVTVTATVTGCLGIASGTGITVASFQCKASFVESGHRHTEVLRGSSTLLTSGATVTAVVVPGDPASLSSVGAAGHRQSGWSRYAPGVVSLAALIVCAIVVWAGARRRAILRTR